ncbi:unnamed protein product [Allacma fusca]|uniref:RING-type domain-containing protein n=1 Tax=Allacma fusca TaxID=39272 RepID=A0A8J2LMX0_9HEXA|nr:unnamed protein product [Allacma fusca]
MGDIRITKEEAPSISSIIDDPMKEEIRRRNTYSSHSNQPLKEEQELLSAKGFYLCSAKPNKVQCFSCALQIEYPLTFPISNIDSEHRKRSPNCTFLNNGPSGNISSVSERNDTSVTDGPSHLANVSSSSTSNNSGNRNSVPEAQSHNPPNIPCVMEPTHRMITNAQPRNDLNLYTRTTVNYEAMKSELERLRTFYGVPAWPVNFIEPEACARAGFFFLQNDDRFKNVKLNLTIKQLFLADMEPTCSSGGSSSGIESGSPGSSERCSTSDVCSSSSGNSSGEEDAEYMEKSFSKEKDLEEEVRKLREARQCKICMDNEVAVVFLPCGHLVSCTACATAFTNCALCRQPIKAVVRTYMS